jgi:regulator of protease activity HflC (stomatin/prohibitin superfamily)
MEKIKSPISGYLALVTFLLLLIASVFIVILAIRTKSGWLGALAFLSFTINMFLMAGIIVVSPNHSRVLTFFGKYVGTVKENGLFFVNPLFTKQKLSLRAQNLEGQTLKVNDKMGNPIKIGAVCVWQVKDTFKAVFDVDNYAQYVKIQSEAAIRHLGTTCAYDHMEDEKAAITLRDGGEKVNELLEQELNERLAPAGIAVREARISHLAYAPEIAGAMLQRQQATAIVAARTKIVEGAVGMVELALEQLSKKEIVVLDEEKKAAMVSNLMVVLCGEKAATPVLNTGTLYQ